MSVTAGPRHTQLLRREFSGGGRQAASARACRMPPVMVAPMMDVTDRHCRYFLRLVAPRVGLYTEMITAQAVLRGDARRLLDFHPAERPLAAQLGGHEPAELAAAARVVRRYGYDEINLNVGCPSDRVRTGRFGACLMLEPQRVARCVAAMIDAVDVPVTVKTRIGVDDRDSFDFLAAFVGSVAEAGCTTFVVHARKAVLGSLSPHDNLRVPPLRPELVWRLKREFPGLRIVFNGGLTTDELVARALAEVDGAMIGRKAVEDPCFLARVATAHCGGDGMPERAAVVRAMFDYAQHEVRKGARLNHITRHMLGLYRGLPGARAWRRMLAEQATLPGAAPELLLRSLAVAGTARAA